MIALIKYYYKLYIKQNKFIIPIICFCIIQSIYYCTGKEKFSPSIMLFANLVFLIMAWISFTYCNLQDLRTEQIAFLKINNRNVFWLSKILFMWSIGIVISLLGTIWPLLCNKLTGSEVIPSNVIILGFIMQLLISFMGAMIGMILQPRVTGSKNNSILFICFFSVLSLIKMPLTKEYSFAKVISWVLPPVNDLTSACIGNINFSLEFLIVPIVISIIYIIVQIYIYIKLMNKILF